MGTVLPALGGNRTEDASCEPTLLPEPEEDPNVFGEPKIIPRVGEEYQVLLPDLISWTEHDERLRSEVKCEETANGFLLGLPLSIMWVQSGYDNGKCEPSDSEGKVRSVINGKGSNWSVSFPVPGSSYEQFSKMEEEIFLLGLYIFERDFVRLKNFMGSRNIGVISSHYYGKFYRSERYHTWLECRKMKGRKFACGQKIFTGLRQQELMARLLPQLSEEGRHKLLQVSEKFTEGKVLLEEYVMTLKNVVGMNNLVEAVGIGKGKQDLTRMTLEKSDRATHLHPQWPTRKACSALSQEDILNFLQGGARLSNAHSHDLFWEAVWPRLLAKGWHSEQPKNSLFSKEYLVFLIPGVKRFSRRKLVKGYHYFDSTRDVLNKVASDPRILDPEDESGKEFTVEEVNSDREKSPDQDHQSYIKPRTLNHGGTEGMKFMIIDTAVASGETCRLREVRGLPAEINSALPGMVDERNSTIVRTNAQDPSGESQHLSFNMVEADMYNPVKIINSDKKQTPANNKAVSDHLIEAVHSYRQGFNDNQGKPTTKCQQKRRKKLDENCLGPEPRKCQKMKFSSDKRMGSCSSVGKLTSPESEKEETNSLSGTNFTGNGDLVTVGENETDQKPQPSMLIDLNLPIMLDSETTEPVNVEMLMEQNNQLNQQDGVPVAATANAHSTNSEPQPSANSRRQSGRTRLMSTRAVEALASRLMAREIKRRW